jgi:type IV pilus assembly protein PilW
MVMVAVTETKKKEEGVTLIELMIVLVIATFLVAGIYSLFITQSRSYSVQDQVAGVQQDARAALNIMARDIRMAGLGIGGGSGTGFTDGSNSVTLASNPAGSTFNYALEPVNRANAPDTITVIYGAVRLGTVAISGVTGNSITLTSAVPSDIPTTAILIAFDLQKGRLYTGTVSGTTITISSTGFPSGTRTIEGGKAYWVKAITYSVTASNGNPGLGVLRRNENTGAGAQPLAGDGINTYVEDLQIAYQVAGDTGWYNDPATDFPAGKTRADIRMVRINISVRTAVQDATVQDAASTAAKFNQPQLEDHTAGLAGPDGFRRRVYTTEVKVRNLK